VEQENKGQIRRSCGRFSGRRVNCEYVPQIPAGAVRWVLDDPRKIPYPFVWLGERGGKVKEAVRVSAYSEPGPSDWTGWVQFKRADAPTIGTYTRIRTIERPLPRNGSKTLLLVCWECRKACRALYGWEARGQYTNSVERRNWQCRACAGLRYSSEGDALLFRGGLISRLLGLPVPDSPSPRPEPWLPYVFASPMDAVAAGFAELGNYVP